MKTKSLFMIFFLFLGVLQVHSQEVPVLEDVKKKCAALVNIQQECDGEGGVTLTFNVANNGFCKAQGYTVMDGLGWGQSVLTNLPPLTVSSTSLTYSGAAPGTVKCFTIILWAKERECCRIRQCIKVKEDCCDLEATVVSTSPTSCYGNDGEAVIVMSGGNPSPDYTLEWENTSGPGSGYEEYTPADAANGAELTDLAAGTWEYTVTDQDKCEITGSFVIAGDETFEVDISTTPDDCEVAGSGTAEFDISGGTAPYWVYISGPSGGSSNGSSPISFSGLRAGLYSYTITDANGCEMTGTFEIEDEDGPGDCDAFKAIEATEADANSNGYWSTTLTSTVQANITVTLDAAVEPDEAFFYINGSLQEAWTAGSDECDDEIYGDYYPTWHVEERTFKVHPCDEVKIAVKGNVCPIQAYTVWTLTVDCVECNIGGGDFTGGTGGRSNVDNSNRIRRTTSEAVAQEMALQFQARNSSARESVKIYPNPVSDYIKITNMDRSMNYKTVTVFDNSGKTMLFNDVSDLSQLEIDASDLPLGTYFIEIIDHQGNSVIEKFVKINQ